MSLLLFTLYLCIPQAVEYVVDQVNRKAILPRGLQLGFVILDNCGDADIAMIQSKRFIPQKCQGYKTHNMEFRYSQHQQCLCMSSGKKIRFDTTATEKTPNKENQITKQQPNNNNNNKTKPQTNKKQISNLVFYATQALQLSHGVIHFVGAQ